MFFKNEAKLINFEDDDNTIYSTKTLKGLMKRVRKAK